MARTGKNCWVYLGLLGFTRVYRAGCGFSFFTRITSDRFGWARIGSAAGRGVRGYPSLAARGRGWLQIKSYCTLPYLSVMPAPTGYGRTGPPSLRGMEGRECVWVPGAVTSLQVLQTLVVFEVEAVTKALHGRYRALRMRIRNLNRRCLTTNGREWTRIWKRGVFGFPGPPR